MDDDTTMRMMADRNPQQLNAILQEVAAEQEHRKGNNAKVIEGQESQRRIYGYATTGTN